jgi:hypothetical protein
MGKLIQGQRVETEVVQLRMLVNAGKCGLAGPVGVIIILA